MFQHWLCVWCGRRDQPNEHGLRHRLYPLLVGQLFLMRLNETAGLGLVLVLRCSLLLGPYLRCSLLLGP